MIRLGRLGTITTEIKSLFRRFGFTGVNDGGQENLVPPHDGRRPATTGDIQLPGNVVFC